MDKNHIRSNQSDGSVSLIHVVQTGFLAKSQLPSIPDPIVIPSLALICKREQLDRLLKLLVLIVRIELDYFNPSRKHAYIMFTPLNPTFI